MLVRRWRALVRRRAALPGRWVWLDRSGNPQAPPPSTDAMFFTALFTGITVTVGATVALTLCYLFCRATLDRHRLARWESAWAAVGPRWTSRR